MDLGQKLIWRKGLWQQLNRAYLEQVPIRCHVQDLRFRALQADTFCQFQSVQTRHGKVSNEQGNTAVVGSGRLNCFVPIFGRKDSVTSAAKNVGGQLNGRFVVVNEQNRRCEQGALPNQ